VSDLRVLPSIDDPRAVGEFANQALDAGEEEKAIPLVRAAAERGRRPLMWHWLGLLQRALDQHGEALEAFEKAATIAPRGPMIALARAQTAMEAGLPAVELFETARSLAPGNEEIILGLAAARHAVGDGERAAADLQAILDKSPTWIVGHEQFAQFQSALGHPERATDSLENALKRFPDSQALWATLLFVELRRGAYAALRPILDRARAAGVQSEEFEIFDGIVAAEFDRETYPPELFDKAPEGRDADLDRWRIRHLLRIGEPKAAIPFVDRAIANDAPIELWSYAATVWRLANDPRSEWLEGDSRLVSITDLTAALPPLGELAETLRALHVAKSEHLDQSVRGGTQTEAPLFSSVDPTIRQLRSVVVGAVEKHLAQLPERDSRHPLLREPRDRRIRFSGSWSVRLKSGGRHSNHIHPQGWISSALYIALPRRAEGEPEDAGWLTLGEPDDKLGLDLPPWRKIEPKPGQLVLFPSWMWHGTRPFREGERLTVAFDVAIPYGS
jgi:tetratricopeptide (TPR) repeat protein